MAISTILAMPTVPSSQSLIHRFVVMLMALAVMVTSLGMHVPAAHADAQHGSGAAVSGHNSSAHALNDGHATSSGDALQSKQACLGTECGHCAAAVSSSALSSPSLYGLPSDHVMIDSSVRPPEPLFRPPIRRS